MRSAAGSHYPIGPAEPGWRLSGQWVLALWTLKQLELVVIECSTTLSDVGRWQE